MTAEEIIIQMEALRNERQAKELMRFFKTAPGQYGDGDAFLGIKVPQTRAIVKLVKDVPLREVPELLTSRWHEVRLCGLLILVAKFEKQAKKRLETDVAAVRSRDEIVKIYLEYAAQANNWDLVDLSAPKILGHWLMLPTLISSSDALFSVEKSSAATLFLTKKSAADAKSSPLSLQTETKLQVLDRLAASNNLWQQRISMVCTWKTSQQGDPSWCLRYAEKHLRHPHDLMHKAVGWMLREMGKRVSMDLLREFLQQHIHEMSRTTLRYAIEKMPDAERKAWMSL